MTSPALDAFIAEAAARSRQQPDPADCVLALAPLMLDLIDQAGSFLEPQHSSTSTPTKLLDYLHQPTSPRHPANRVRP